MTLLFDKLSGYGPERTLSQSVSANVVAVVNAAIRGARWRERVDSPAFSSVLNFGNGPLAPFGTSTIELKALTTGVCEAIAMFEPRLVASSIRIAAHVDRAGMDPSRPNVQWPKFQIHGALRSSGEPFSMLMRIDVLHGHATLEP